MKVVHKTMLNSALKFPCATIYNMTFKNMFYIEEFLGLLLLLNKHCTYE
jgi:hypothetical protein